MLRTTHRFSSPRPSGRFDSDLDWMMGENYLPAVSPDRTVLWRALEGLGAQVGEVYEQEGLQPIRHVILPEGWTKQQPAYYPDNRLAVFDASDNLRLHVDCHSHCSNDLSHTAMVGRYQALVEWRKGEHWGVAIDRWGVRAPHAEHRVLHQVYTNSASHEAHHQMIERWLDEKYPGWRYPALTWDLDLSWWRRRAYVSHLKQIQNGVIPVC